MTGQFFLPTAGLGNLGPRSQVSTPFMTGQFFLLGIEVESEDQGWGFNPLYDGAILPAAGSRSGGSDAAEFQPPL